MIGIAKLSFCTRARERICQRRAGKPRDKIGRGMG